MDYSKTLNLPKTDFPMKANLPQREPELQEIWMREDVYAASLRKKAPKGSFILHDGPPYSNGDVHVGNAMQNKLPKDFITRYKSMDGFNAPFIPGWDNHGMPIENNVAAEFRKKHIPMERLAIRKRCREYAQGWVEKQKEQYIRLGIRGDWERPYLTMDARIEAAIVRVFGELAERGFIYRGLRPILWCPTCETALADAEIEYGDAVSASIYVFFPLAEDPQGIFDSGCQEPGVLIWTTTPWTIPANLAVAVHPDYEYVLAELDGRVMLLAARLLDRTQEHTGRRLNVLRRLRGSDLEGLVFKHPLFERPSPLVYADYVTLDEGTGVVHTAPGHGREDFETGRKYNLGDLCPVDDKGRFTAEAGPFESLTVWEGDKAVSEALTQSGMLVASGEISHSYPHCWRCHNPVIFRTTVQWFMNLGHNGHRERALQAIQHVDWLPAESINRITAMVGAAPDWCVSRQRAWGVGIPVFFCDSCGSELLDRNLIEHVAGIIEKETADAWFTRPIEDLLPAGTRCGKCSGEKFHRESDILDVWFDSGSTCRSVLDSDIWPELSYPADVYLEGNDQHRGWFNKSLMIGVATKDSPPFRKVVTNGWMVDAEGRAMHKTRGNVINTMDIIPKYGADVFRLTSASFNVLADARLGDEALQRAADAYRRIRNTFRFLLANLADFDPKNAVPYAEMEEIDRWMLHRLQQLIAEVRSGYESYEFHRVVHEIHDFCAVDLSSLYLDVLKDRLYADPQHSQTRLSAQTTLAEILGALTRLVAPVLVHTAEEVWQYWNRPDQPPSVHLADFPTPDESLADAALASSYEQLLGLREQVFRTLEEARQSGAIGKPMEAMVTLSGEAAGELARAHHDRLAPLFIVSKVDLAPGSDGPGVSVAPAPGVKCERCWLVREDVGSHSKHPDLCSRCAGVVEDLEPEEG